MSKELKPCPFCGGEVVIYQNYNEYGIWSVSCDACRVEMVSGVRDILIAAWNVRPLEDVAPKIRKEITEILKDLSAAHGRASRLIATLKENNQRMKKDNQVYRDMLNSLLNEEVYHLDNAAMTNIKYELDNRGKDTDAPAKESEGEDE